MVDLVGVDYFTFLIKIHLRRKPSLKYPDCPISNGLSPYLFVLKTKKSKLWAAVTRLNGVQSRSSFIRCSCRGNGENHTITWIVSVPQFGDFQRLSKSARLLIPWWGETSATMNPNRTVSVHWAQVIKVSPLGRLWGGRTIFFSDDAHFHLENTPIIKLNKYPDCSIWARWWGLRGFIFVSTPPKSIIPYNCYHLSNSSGHHPGG